MTKDELTNRIDELVETIERAGKMITDLSHAACYYENDPKGYKMFQINACAIGFMASLSTIRGFLEAAKNNAYPIKNHLHRDIKTNPEREWESYLSVVNAPGKENGGLFAYKEN